VPQLVPLQYWVAVVQQVVPHAVCVEALHPELQAVPALLQPVDGQVVPAGLGHDPLLQ
jgi:hypothetical protein